MSIVISRSGCAYCGKARFASHRSDCAAVAAEYVAELKRDGWNKAEGAPRCPECGVPSENWTDTDRRIDDGEEMHVTCPSCEHEYKVEMQISYSFSADAK